MTERAKLLAELRERATELAVAGRAAFPAMCGTMSSSDNPERVPVGLYSEESTIKHTAGAFLRMLDAFEGFEVYRPSNGTEGESFMCRWCQRCAKDNLDPDTGDGGCDIIVYTMAFDENSPEYPRAWRYGEDGQPMCVEFQERGE